VRQDAPGVPQFDRARHIKRVGLRDAAFIAERDLRLGLIRLDKEQPRLDGFRLGAFQDFNVQRHRALSICAFVT
jgi:hypothetical protein